MCTFGIFFAPLKLFDFDKLVDALTGYTETRIALLKMDVSDGLSVAVTKLVLFSLVSLLSIFVLLFFFVGISQWLNSLLASVFLGYFIVAAFFGLVLVGVLVSREKIRGMVAKKIESAQRKLKTENNVETRETGKA